MIRNAVVLFMLLDCFCRLQADRASALHRFRTAVVKVETANKLKEILKKKEINCRTYEEYCSKIIENSPSLKLHPEAYQRSCENKLRPHVCKESVFISPNATTTTTTTRS